MLPRWTVGVLIFGVLFSVFSSSEGVEKPKGSNGRIKKIFEYVKIPLIDLPHWISTRTQQTLARRGAARRDDDVVQYDQL